MPLSVKYISQVHGDPSLIHRIHAECGLWWLIVLKGR